MTYTFSLVSELLPNRLTHNFPCAHLLLLLLQSADAAATQLSLCVCCLRSLHHLNIHLQALFSTNIEGRGPRGLI